MNISGKQVEVWLDNNKCIAGTITRMPDEIFPHFVLTTDRGRKVIFNRYVVMTLLDSNN